MPISNKYLGNASDIATVIQFIFICYLVFVQPEEGMGIYTNIIIFLATLSCSTRVLSWILS